MTREAETRARADAATKGPWFPNVDDLVGGWQVANKNVPADGWINDTAETWTFASADAPTYTFTIPGDLTTKYAAGQRLKLTNGAAVKYFIVTAVSYGAPNTTVTVYGGTDYIDRALASPSEETKP